MITLDNLPKGEHNGSIPQPPFLWRGGLTYLMALSLPFAAVWSCWAVEDSTQEVSMASRSLRGELGAIQGDLSDVGQRLAAINGGTVKTQLLCSYYADFFHGRQMSSGITFRQDQRWIASLQYPQGSIIILERPGRRSWGVVGDKISPKYAHRTDLSRRIAAELGILEVGVAQVEALVILPAGGIHGQK